MQLLFLVVKFKSRARHRKPIELVKVENTGLSQRQDGQDNPRRRAKPLPRQLPRQQGRKCPFGKTSSRFCEIVRK